MAGGRDEAAVTGRGIALRCAYAAGLVAAVVLAINLDGMARDSMAMPPEFLAIIKPAALAGFAFVGAPLLFLVVQPYWWGKLFVLAPAFSWAGFTGAMTSITGWTPILLIPLACAGVMLAVAVVHQMLDPRFSGAPLR